MSTCIICKHREVPEDRWLTCVPCETDQGRLLDELARVWPLLLDRASPAVDPPKPWSVVPGLHFDAATYEASLVPIRVLAADRMPAGPTRSRSGPPTRGTREAPVPVDLDYLDLTAAARPSSLTVKRTPEQVGHLATATELDFWVKDWAGHLDQDLPQADVPSLAGWLRERLHWACTEHLAIDEFAQDLRRILGPVRRRADEVDDRLVVGRCPAVIDERECGAKLRADPWLDVIECPRCTTRWHRSQWLILAAAARQEEPCSAATTTP